VTENFFSLLVCVREKGRERGAPPSWLWFSAAAGERERGSTREVWARLRRLLRQNLGLVLCEISASSRAGSSPSSLALVLYRWREKGGARRRLGWTPASSPASWAPGFRR
jgi:hypothetical protein